MYTSKTNLLEGAEGGGGIPPQLDELCYEDDDVGRPV